MSSACDLPYPLTPEQTASFERDGFLLLTDALSTGETADLQVWTADVKSWPDKKGEHMAYAEKRADGSMGICRTESESLLHLILLRLFDTPQTMPTIIPASTRCSAASGSQAS